MIGQPILDKIALERLMQDAETFESLKPTGFDGDVDGYDGAIVGLTQDGQLVYSKDKMIELTLLADEDMKVDDAIQWLEYNTFNTYIGNQSPIFIDQFS